MGCVFCVIRGILKSSNRGVYVSELIKMDAIGQGCSTQIELKSTSVKKDGNVGCLSGGWD